MSKIQKLSDQLTNMIAAGEVVERPMGVVKELVENSIDAGATEIEVRIEEGGLKKIQVTDNGSGMDPADAVNALQRHATSKINKIEDLWSIHTMGFRGEALPSIASVSKFELLTNDGESSTCVKVEYGKTTFAGPHAAPEGTLITVEGLFYRTPARLKHMKSAQTEGSAVIELMERFSFSQPDIAFRLYSNGILRLETRGNGDLKEILYRIYGKEAAQSAVEVNFEDYDFRCQGILVMPQFNRASRNYVQLYLNDRVIRSYRLQKAILRAYEPYHAPDRYPICVIRIYADYKLVDVNVHPSKWEIRLSKEKQLEQLLEYNISTALKKEYQIRAVPSFVQDPYRVREEKTDYTPVPKAIQQSMDLDEAEPVPEITPVTKPQEEAVKPMEPEIAVETEKPELPVTEVQPETEPEAKEEAEIVKGPRLPDLKIIGQFHSDYIIAEAADGLYIIDQHAAAERMNFERISKLVNQKPYVMQPLLVPVTIDIAPSLMNNIDELTDFLSEVGLTPEMFGNNTIMFREIPLWLTGCEVETVVRDLIDRYDPSHLISRAELQKHAVATSACHGSVRFNRRLTKEEMLKIVGDLNRCDQPFNCPHGRPTLIKITDKDLRKEFERG